VHRPLEQQENDAERAVHGGEEAGAQPRPSGATAGDQCPPHDLKHRCREGEPGARLARPHAGPSQREEERGNDGRFDQWPLATGENENVAMTERLSREIWSPRTSDHQCASQKTSMDPKVVAASRVRPVARPARAQHVDASSDGAPTAGNYSGSKRAWKKRR
jgi:hypothetical protein